MQYTIKNTYLSLTVDTLGAQAVSVKNNQGDELLWQGDKAVWAEHAPILFPYAGRIKGGKFTVDGKFYTAPVHGFARSFEHNMILKEDNLITFELTSCPKSREFFPYDFCLRTSFILSGHSVHHKVDISNLGDKSFGFGLGFHAGFNLPFDNNHKTSDYFLEFDTPQSPCVLGLDKDILIDGTMHIFKENVTEIPLNDSFFDTSESIVLSGLSAKFISIVERDTGKRIEFDIQDFPYLVLWSAKTTPLRFFCVEPWLSLPDRFDAPTEWENKAHYKTLDIGERFYVLSRVRLTL